MTHHFAWILIAWMALAVSSSEALAHGGEKHDTAQEKNTTAHDAPAHDENHGDTEAPSPYALEPDEIPLEEDSLSLSRGGLGDNGLGEALGTPDTMADSGHQGHSMPEVELAEHSLVSPKQKGYGAAVAVTVLSGLVFGFLSFKRLGE